MRSTNHTLEAVLLIVCLLASHARSWEPFPLNDHTRLGQRFTAMQSFGSLVVVVPSWLDAEGGLTLTLWDSPERKQELTQQVFTDIRDNARVSLHLPKPLPRGTYYWEAHDRTGKTRIGLYADKRNDDTDDCAYFDGKPDHKRKFVSHTVSIPYPWDTKQLIANLKSAKSADDRTEACRQLAVVGSREAVPMLARLLADKELSHMARYALEPMPYAEVDAGFRDALKTLEGQALIGVINSIGKRGDAKAVESLAKLCQGPDSEVGSAAAIALGRIGTPVAAGILSKALQDATAGHRPALYEALLNCAGQLAAHGNTGEASAVYDRLQAGQTPSAIRTAAARGAILTRGADGVPLLLAHLRSADPAMVSAALWVVQRELPGPQVTEALAAELPKLPVTPQLQLTRALCARADPAALPALRRLAAEGTRDLRVAVIRGLPQCRDSSVVPTLIEALTDADPDVAKAAQKALTSLPGKDADTRLAPMLKSAQKPQRLLAIQLVGARSCAAALPALLQAAQDSDREVRTAALKVLEKLAGPDEFPPLLELLVNATEPDDIKAIERALRAVCAKAGKPAAHAKALIAVLPQAQPPLKRAVLRLLHVVGGNTSCQVVIAATKDAHEHVRAEAFRLLGDWKTAAAAPSLLELAKTSTDATGKLLCLRGYIRLAGSAELPVERRLDMCRHAAPLVQRDEEVKLLLGMLGGLPTADALPLATPYLETPAVRDEAGAAVLAIAEKLVKGGKNKAADKALQRVTQVAPDTDLARRAQALLAQTE